MRVVKVEKTYITLVSQVGGPHSPGEEAGGQLGDRGSPGFHGELKDIMGY